MTIRGPARLGIEPGVSPPSQRERRSMQPPLVTSSGSSAMATGELLTGLGPLGARSFSAFVAVYLQASSATTAAGSNGSTNHVGLDHLVEQIVDVLPITGAGVTLIDPKLEPRYVAASDFSAMNLEGLQTEFGEGPCIAAYQARAPVFVADLQAENRFAAFRLKALEIGLKAVFTFPLRQEDNCLGALDLYSHAAGALTGHEAEAAQTLGRRDGGVFDQRSK